MTNNTQGSIHPEILRILSFSQFKTILIIVLHQLASFCLIIWRYSLAIPIFRDFCVFANDFWYSQKNNISVDWIRTALRTIVSGKKYGYHLPLSSSIYMKSSLNCNRVKNYENSLIRGSHEFLIKTIMHQRKSVTLDSFCFLLSAAT